MHQLYLQIRIQIFENAPHLMYAMPQYRGTVGIGVLQKRATFFPQWLKSNDRPRLISCHAKDNNSAVWSYVAPVAFEIQTSFLFVLEGILGVS